MLCWQVSFVVVMLISFQEILIHKSVAVVQSNPSVLASKRKMLLTWRSICQSLQWSDHRHHLWFLLVSHCHGFLSMFRECRYVLGHTTSAIFLCAHVVACFMLILQVFTLIISFTYSIQIQMVTNNFSLFYNFLFCDMSISISGTVVTLTNVVVM